MESLGIPDAGHLEVRPVWQSLTEAHRYLAELKGLCQSLPNAGVLIDTLWLQEAKDSAEIENIITTHDELYIRDQQGQFSSPAAKEVQNYVAALRLGHREVRESGLIRLQTILQVQARIEQNHAGLRTQAGTVLRNQGSGEVIYEPPQEPRTVMRLMDELIAFLHGDDGLDPLLRMAIAHHLFESIHPFYDGNGRTGRILNLLVLQREHLLDVPLLYLSRYITLHKDRYYDLLQSTRESGDWVEWCVYLLRGVALTAKSGIKLIDRLRDLMQQTKGDIRSGLPKIYSQELLNNLFRYPYTKIDFLVRDLAITRITATRYLDHLASRGVVVKTKIGRTNFYINKPLYALLTSIELDG